MESLHDSSFPKINCSRIFSILPIHIQLCLQLRCYSLPLVSSFSYQTLPRKYICIYSFKRFLEEVCTWVVLLQRYINISLILMAEKASVKTSYTRLMYEFVVVYLPKNLFYALMDAFSRSEAFCVVKNYPLVLERRPRRFLIESNILWNLI